MASQRPVCTKVFKLNNGLSMPAVGLGTFQGRVGTDDNERLEESIIHALRAGYRLIDTAQFYGVEPNVGRAVRASGVPRADITVVTKFWGEWHHDPAAALRASLEALGLDYVDVFLMHWPWATTPAPEKRPLRKAESPTFVETWRAMEGLVGERCRGVGVSNFTQKLIEELELGGAKVLPCVNQVELHAFNPNLKLVPYCQSKGIHVMSWSTMGGARLGKQILNHELFTSIAGAHDCSPAVVSLSWAVQRGVTVIPKSASTARLDDNIRLVTLSDKEMGAMNDAHRSIGAERLADGIQSLKVEVDGKQTIQGWTKVDFGWEDEEGNCLT